jgi:UDP-N-acetylglucosamine:LPS N-acetylglucosamine transferase
MAAAARSLGRLDAAARLADLVLKVAGIAKR